MLKTLRRTGSRLLASLLCLSLAFLPISGALALAGNELEDEEPPVLIHRQLETGVAGELQTFLARVSDDFGISEVTLYYRCLLYTSDAADE